MTLWGGYIEDRLPWAPVVPGGPVLAKQGVTGLLKPGATTEIWALRS